jgi:thioredoxin-related protein
MKRIFSLLLLAALSFSALAADAHTDWLTDISLAKKQAKAEQKRILMLFTGSDWCPTCIKWDKEALSSPEFQMFAKTNFVLLLVDYPEKKKISKAQLRANNVLGEQYGIELYPTFVIADAKGKKLEEFNYIEGGPKPLIERLQKAK